MTKSEESDLLILVRSLMPSELKSFRKQFLAQDSNHNNIKIQLLDKLRQQKEFDKEGFLIKFKISKSKYSILKHKLLKELVNYLKLNSVEFSEVAMQNECMEFEILLSNGLFIKANRKLKRLLEIAIEKCDFNVCCSLLRKAIKYNLYHHSSIPDSLEEASQQLKKYYELARNLDTYIMLTHEIVNLHYQFLDKRAKNRNAILDYLEHNLVKDPSSAKSVLAGYHRYLITSLIYIGDNNYEECKKYTLIAINFLKANGSPYRNDSLRLLYLMNNYLDASLNLLETEPFDKMYPEMIALLPTEKGKADAHMTSVYHQLISTLRLNYLWLTKDYSAFIDEYKELKKTYEKWNFIGMPSFRLEFLLGCARMFFLGGDLKMANKYCKEISKDKSNPTSLYISCGKILEVMVNYDLGNYKFLSHLSRTSKYFLNNRGRLFELERSFFNRIVKVKSYLSKSEKALLFKQLHEEINTKLLASGELILDKKINLLDWLDDKFSE